MQPLVVRIHGKVAGQRFSRFLEDTDGGRKAFTSYGEADAAGRRMKALGYDRHEVLDAQTLRQVCPSCGMDSRFGQGPNCPPRFHHY